MSKDVNVHVKVKDTAESKQMLEDFARSVDALGGRVEQMGTKSSRALTWFTKGLKDLIGPLGFAALAMAVATTALKIAHFFDQIKTRADEAVRKVESIRIAFKDLFEAMNAFDEKSQKQVTQETFERLQKTKVSIGTGLPIETAYARQFKGMVESGQITQKQYNQGLEGMLTYGERRGGEATPDLITMMAGWGMNTPEQQGAFSRQITAGAGISGLTDKDLIEELGRVGPTIKAMGWTPEQAIGAVATLASGEIGRQKLALPAMTLQGLLTPNLTDIKKLGIPENIAQDPLQLLGYISAKGQQMEQKPFMQMLTSLYGGSAAGTYKLLSTSQAGMGDLLQWAGGPKGLAAISAEEAGRQGTLGAQLSGTEATVSLEQLKTLPTEEAWKRIRQIGEAKKEMFRIREPIRQFWDEIFVGNLWGDWREKAVQEEAAKRGWEKSLSPEEFGQITGGLPGESGQIGMLNYYWYNMSPQQKLKTLTGGNKNSPVIINNDSSNRINYYPRVGDDMRGPRTRGFIE